MNIKRAIGVALISLLLVGCAEQKRIGSVTYDTYGLLNQNDKKNPEIEYAVCWPNVFWGVLLVETVIAPVYFFGFSLFEPVGPKQAVKGAVGEVK